MASGDRIPRLQWSKKASSVLFFARSCDTSSFNPDQSFPSSRRSWTFLFRQPRSLTSATNSSRSSSGAAAAASASVVVPKTKGNVTSSMNQKAPIKAPLTFQFDFLLSSSISTWSSAKGSEKTKEKKSNTTHEVTNLVGFAHRCSRIFLAFHHLPASQTPSQVFFYFFFFLKQKIIAPLQARFDWNVESFVFQQNSFYWIFYFALFHDDAFVDSRGIVTRFLCEQHVAVRYSELQCFAMKGPNRKSFLPILFSGIHD